MTTQNELKWLVQNIKRANIWEMKMLLRTVNDTVLKLVDSNSNKSLATYYISQNIFFLEYTAAVIHPLLDLSNVSLSSYAGLILDNKHEFAPRFLHVRLKVALQRTPASTGILTE